MTEGAIAAVGNIGFPTALSTDLTTGAGVIDHSLRVDNGDLGALISTGGGNITGEDSAGDAEPINAVTGNIRVIQAASIGTATVATATTGSAVGDGLDIDTAGNVGVVRTTGTGATDVMDINDAFDDVLTATGLDEDGFTSKAIGGSYQLVDCATLFSGNLVADGGIGTIRAQGMGLVGLEPVIHVNADNKGNDGIINLIDITGGGANGHFGLLSSGGPHILSSSVAT